MTGDASEGRAAQEMAGPAPRELIQAVAQFNEGDYFGAHETLEELWRREHGRIRELYQGIIQIAVGCHHRERANPRGARLCFERGLARVVAFQPVCLGLDIRQMVVDVEQALADLAAGSRAGSARPRIALYDSSSASNGAG